MIYIRKKVIYLLKAKKNKMKRRGYKVITRQDITLLHAQVLHDLVRHEFHKFAHFEIYSMKHGR